MDTEKLIVSRRWKRRNKIFTREIIAMLVSLLWSTDLISADRPKRPSRPPAGWRVVMGASGLPTHRYPRVATFTWGGAVAEWYAKHDLIDIGNHDADFARAIKSINPNAIILPTGDWNAGFGMEPLPQEWITQNSKGQKINLYTQDTWYLDITDFCPKVNGKRYNEALPEYVLSRIDINTFDGIATDGVWDAPHSAEGDIDLDRNGRNDFNEHGVDWISEQLVRGIEKVLTTFRNRMPANKVILLNSGGFHGFGWPQSNGVLLEHTPFLYDFNWFKERYDDFMSQSPNPHVIIIDGNPSSSMPFTPNPSKNDFRLMRFLLGCALLGDGYLSFTDVEAGEHYYTKYYDEYDLDLGYPKGPPQEIRPFIWIRFFDLGAMILNAGGAPVTVTEAELRSRNGYDGPYYAFRGGQDPQINNGQQFSSATLFGATTTLGDGNKVTNGDAVILLKEPKSVVADVVVDNIDGGTSPASQSAELSGAWTSDCDDGGSFYTVRCAEWFDFYGFARAEPGSGEALAVFRPSIGVPGYYEVFEWHGYFGEAPEAVREGTNVPYTIKHANGEKVISLNQAQNWGKWNSLGTYYFASGRNSHVAINNNADGPVMADAVKFVFRDANPNRDTTPPQPPKGVKVVNQ